MATYVLNKNPIEMDSEHYEVNAKIFLSTGQLICDGGFVLYKAGGFGPGDLEQDIQNKADFEEAEFVAENG